MKIKANVMPETAIIGRRITQISPPETRIFLGHGDTTVLCGSCSCVLAEDIYLPHLKQMLLKCNKCHNINQVTTYKQ